MREKLFPFIVFPRGLAIGFSALFACSIAASSESADVQLGESGLVAWYDFADDSGQWVRDRSGFGSPLDLKILKPPAVKREPGRLQIHGATSIQSQASASKIVEAVKRSGEFSLEAWIEPAKASQTGPARIVTLSKNGSERNFTLGQDGKKYDVRFRTTKTNGNGIPSTSAGVGDSITDLSYVVFTRDRRGNTALYVDGKIRQRAKAAGSTSNWDSSFRLALGDEFSGDRQWLGSYRRLGIYSRSLAAGEVAERFRKGPSVSPVSAETLAARHEEQQRQHFETRIAPLLATHCLECHDTASRKGSLDLSRKEAAFAGGDSGQAIVAGDPDESLVWQSVADDVMPLDRPPLSEEQKKLLHDWIEDDAVWSVDWIDPAIYKPGKGFENWVRRLTISEYIETVRSAVGVDIAEEARRILPPDTRADGFANTAYNLSVDFEHVDAYARLAEIIVDKMDVDRYVSQFTNQKRLTDDDMRALISSMGKWILRGPLNEREVVDFRGVTTSVASAGGNFEEACAFLLEAMLQSPRFLYRIENQRGSGSVFPVGPYELASRISYLVWGAPPDQELIRAAESGDLYDSKQLREQVERMLKDERAKLRSREFISQWLDLDRLRNMSPNRERFPDWDPQLAEDMRAETLAFFDEIVWQQNRPLTDLLNAQITFATPRLARHYGLDPKGEGMARYDLSDVPHRGGLLTHGSVLTIGGDDASMVTRGLFVLNDLLFSEVGDPPPGLDTTPVPPSPGRSHRAIAMERVQSTACGGCHSRFEPLAFGLERFDGLGSYAEVDEHGNRLRDDGEILFPGSAEPVAYRNSAQMMDLLAASDRVGECLTRKLTQFALGRPLVAADAASIREIHRQATEAGGTYADILTAIALSDLVQMTRSEEAL